MLSRQILALTLTATLTGLAGAQNGSSANAALGVEVSGALGGRLVSCPQALNVSAQAVCLYAKSTLDTGKSKIKAKIGARAVGDWKSSGKTASLLLQSGNVGSYVLLAQLSPTEVLAVVDSPKAQSGALASRVAARSAPAATIRPATAPAVTAPAAGVPSGLVNVADLRGLVTATPVAGGAVQLTRAGGLLTVTPGNRSARSATGTLDLSVAPTQGAAGLLVPLDALRALGCTFTAAGGSADVTCGSGKMSVKLQ